MISHCYVLVVLASLLGFSSYQDSTSTVSAAASFTSSADLAVSTDGSCGDATGFTCLGSRFGDCCSSKGWCGKDGAYCDAGCQTSFGNCTATSGSLVKSVSTDGSCGGSTGFVCLGSTFGDCCSEKGWCGENSSYCDAGCQIDFGHCGSSRPDQTTQISTNGSCGGKFDATCLGSTFGDCCSATGWCGRNSSYCDAGCQSAFGRCSTPPSSTSSAPSSPTQTSTTPSLAATALPLPTVQTTGFKLGVAIGCAVVFLAFFALAFFLLRRNRRRNHMATSGKTDVVDGSTTRAWSASGGKAFPTELPSVEYRQELPANEKKTFGAKIEERTV